MEEVGRLADRPDFLVEVRSTYGAAKRKQTTVNCLGGVVTPLFTILGKGITYGGYVHLFPGVTHKDDFLDLAADDISLLSTSFKALAALGIISPGNTPYYQTLYDETNFHYCCCFAPGITFETSLKLDYWNVEVGAVLVVYYIYYALI